MGALALCENVTDGRGWFAVPRKMISPSSSGNSLYGTGPTAIALMTYILATVNWQDGTKPLPRQRVIVRRGQMVTSLGHLSKAIGAKRCAVQRALAKLQKLGFLRRSPDTVPDTISKQMGTVITVCNYDDIMDSPKAGNPPPIQLPITSFKKEKEETNTTPLPPAGDAVLKQVPKEGSPQHQPARTQPVAKRKRVPLALNRVRAAGIIGKVLGAPSDMFHESRQPWFEYLGERDARLFFTRFKSPQAFVTYWEGRKARNTPQSVTQAQLRDELMGFMLTEDRPMATVHDIR